MHQDLSTDATPIATPDTSRPNSPATHLLQGKGRPGGKLSRRDRRKIAGSPAPASSGDEDARPGSRGGKKAAAKKGRVWDEFGIADTASDVTQLDYSTPATEGDAVSQAVEHVEESSWGKRTGKGDFVLKDLDEEMDEILAKANAEKGENTAATGLVGTSLGAIGGLFRNVVGGKTITKEDLEKPLKGMEDHLLKKNVAREAAVRLCESVERDLVGVKTNSFTSKPLLYVLQPT